MKSETVRVVKSILRTLPRLPSHNRVAGGYVGPSTIAFTNCAGIRPFCTVPCARSWKHPLDVCSASHDGKGHLVSARFVNSSRWCQGLAVVVGLVFVLLSFTPLVASVDQEDGESVPVIAIARARASGSASREHATDRVGTLDAHTILVADALQSARDSVSPRFVSGRSVLDISSSFRC